MAKGGRRRSRVRAIIPKVGTKSSGLAHLRRPDRWVGPGEFSGNGILTGVIRVYYMERMEITCVRLPKQLRERLASEAARKGVKPSEIIRRAVDEHLERREAASQNRVNLDA